MTKDQIIENLQRYGLKAPEAMEATRLCDKYIEANSKELSSKGDVALALLVEKMREAQLHDYANRKQLQVKVDNAIKRIKELNKL